jgi:tetratricopeptide (TPR) repeat protein
MNDYRQAEEYIEASLNLASSLNKRNEKIEILHRFGKMYIELGDIDQAIHIFNEGLDLAKTSRNSKFEDIFLARIGDAYALTP